MHTLVEQAAAVASGNTSPVDLVDAALAAIDRSQPMLNAFTCVLAENARARAKELSASAPTGPLHGVPIAVKDLFDVAGVATSGCCAAYHDRTAAADSAVVERLRAAGAVIVAKTNQHELASGGDTQVSSFGPAANPWDPARVPGGSSGGSAAAVAAGVVTAAMGSDSLGSIRIPSSYCGTTGLKTTHGRVSLRGAMPFLPSLDTAGPIATNAEDCALLFRVVAGYDPKDSLSRRPMDTAERPIEVVGISQSFLTSCARETRLAVEAAARVLEAGGCAVEEIEGPDPDGAWTAIVPLFAEFAAAYPDLWEDERVQPETARILAVGRHITGTQLAEAVRHARIFKREFDGLFGQVDALLAPATPFAAPLAAQATVEVEGGTLDAGVGCARFTAPVNLAGLPSVAFPVGFSSEGLPLGAQLIGPDWSEERLLAAVSRYQGATDWHARRPAGGDGAPSLGELPQR